MDEEKNVGIQIYPKLPTAPANTYTELTDKTGSEYRLKKIIEIENYLRAEIERRKHLHKQYKKANSAICVVDTTLASTSMGLGITGVALLSTIVAAPVALVMEGTSIGTGFLCVLAKYANKKLRTKEDKHRKIQILAESKLNTIHDYVSKAMIDGYIDDKEFRLILEEVEKYRGMKEYLRKKMAKENTEKEFIERGREEMKKKFESFYKSEIHKV